MFGTPQRGGDRGEAAAYGVKTLYEVLGAGASGRGRLPGKKESKSKVG